MITKRFNETFNYPDLGVSIDLEVHISKIGKFDKDDLLIDLVQALKSTGLDGIKALKNAKGDMEKTLSAIAGLDDMSAMKNVLGCVKRMMKMSVDQIKATVKTDAPEPTIHEGEKAFGKLDEDMTTWVLEKCNLLNPDVFSDPNDLTDKKKDLPKPPSQQAEGSQ